MNKEMFRNAGVDVDKAIKVFAGVESMYDKYLKRFPNEPYYNNAMDAYDKKEYQTVLEQVHALKGIAGDLGMNDLYNTCQKVVDAIRANNLEEMGPLMGEFTSQYSRIIRIYSDMGLE